MLDRENKSAFGIGRRERGQSLVMFALALMVMLGFVAMTLDVGLAFVEKRSLQNAVDAAALAAAQDFANGESEATATATAIDYLQRNGYNGVDDTIEINIPPTSGTYAGLSGYVEVKASADAPMAFLALFMDGPFTPSARAVAEGTQPVTGSPVGGGSLPPPASVPTNIVCGTPEVDGRVTDSDGYTKLGDLGVGATDYGDVFVACDNNFYYFAMRLNGPDTGGPVANDNAYSCDNGKVNNRQEVEYKNGNFDRLTGVVDSVDFTGFNFTVSVDGSLWTVDVDGATEFGGGWSGIGFLSPGMGIEVNGTELGPQHVLASAVTPFDVFLTLTGVVVSVDVPGSSFIVSADLSLWTVDVDGATVFGGGLIGIGGLSAGMGIEVIGTELGPLYALATEVDDDNLIVCTTGDPNYHTTYDTGWQYVAQGHTFEKLEGSDRARFQIACGATTEHDFILDYLRPTGSSWASDVAGDGSVFKAAPTASASSLEWNLEHPTETGWGDDPGEDVFQQSPPFNPAWPNYDVEYDGWIWEMIYEFKVPKQPLKNCAGQVSFGLYDFSGSTGGLVGIHSSPAKTSDGANVVVQGEDLVIKLVE